MTIYSTSDPSLDYLRSIHWARYENTTRIIDSRNCLEGNNLTAHVALQVVNQNPTYQVWSKSAAQGEESCYLVVEVGDDKWGNFFAVRVRDIFLKRDVDTHSLLQDLIRATEAMGRNINRRWDMHNDHF